MGGGGCFHEKGQVGGCERLQKRRFEKIALYGGLVRDFDKLPIGPKIANVIDKFGVKWDIVIC